MKKFDSFTNRYSLSKTLRFKLIPVGETEANFNAALLLEKDKQRAENYSRAKKLIDKFHKHFIEISLANVSLDKLDTYAELYFKSAKTDADKKELSKLESNLRKQITKSFTSQKLYSKLFKEDLIKEIMPGFLENNEDKAVIEDFIGFSTYFTGFNDNRKNMYSEEEKSTAISFRCINQNLPLFLDNIKSFLKISEVLSDKLEQVDTNFKELSKFKTGEIFTVDFFNMVLTQSGIEEYNNFIGGYTPEHGAKIQGINEFVNHYNQTAEKSQKLPFLKPLYKQILSDRSSVSFLPESFGDDSNEVLEAIYAFFISEDESGLSVRKSIEEIKTIFSELKSYDLEGIYIKNGLPITDLSNKVFGSWSSITDTWNKEYELRKPMKNPKKAEEYYNNMKKAFKSIESFSLTELTRLGNKYTESDTKVDLAGYIASAIHTLCNEVSDSFKKAESLLTTKYPEGEKLSSNNDHIALIKNFLDSIKNLEKFIKPLLGNGKEEFKDNAFYGKLLPLYTTIESVDKIYDKTRNYVTQKPYSSNKIKLNFDNPQFMGGWETKLEIARSSQLFILRNNEYYLGVIERKHNAQFRQDYHEPCDESDEILKICYEQGGSLSKNIPNLLFINGKIQKVNGRKDEDGINRKLEQAKNDNLPSDINKIRLRCGYSVNEKTASRAEITLFVDYYMRATIAYYSKFKFYFKDAAEYSSFADFVADADTQAYQINYQKISLKQLYTYVEKGYLYLFKIYNKDFSPNSKGKPNLHTMYFKALFDAENLKNVVYQLNGGAEMFYREASIKEKDRIIHCAGQPIENKNPDKLKTHSTFDYDIIKDRRYTVNQFMLHLPITLNFKANSQSKLNDDLKEALKACEDNYVIGIDRGERNLLYICVIDGSGKIVEQYSLNEIISTYNDKEYKVNYHKLLDAKETARLKERQNWTSVENIKELKEGYMSAVVKKICELAVKYDAIIALEDLNYGFKNSRKKVEKQVYEKFEKMLIDKLNYYVDKNYEAFTPGGLMNALQLTNKANDKYTSRQRHDGIIFYIPAWMTSKIDPTTGFVDLLRPKYTTVAAAAEFLNNFKSIGYNSYEDYFEFSFSYSDFPGGVTSEKTDWTLCTYGERIENFRNPERNGNWDNRSVNLTEEFKKLFTKHGIEISPDMKSEILKATGKEFFSGIMHLLKLTLQLRNSVTGNEDIDYILSPVKNKDGVFFDSRKYKGNKQATLPGNADANGAYNIARKGLLCIERIKSDDSDLFISNHDWLTFAQDN